MGRGMARLKILDGKVLEAFLQLGNQSPACFMGPHPDQAFLPLIAKGHVVSNQQQVGRAGLSPVDRTHLPILEAEVPVQELFKAFLLQIGDPDLAVNDGHLPGDQVDELVQYRASIQQGETLFAQPGLFGKVQRPGQRAGKQGEKMILPPLHQPPMPFEDLLGEG